jgi:1-acyl-sn-glycerol-3-phosphate acyltransferase
MNPFRQLARHTPSPLDGLVEYAAGALTDAEQLLTGLPSDPIDAWDAEHIRRTLPWLQAVCRTYFRGEVEGLENIPVGEPSLLVGNHSGGLLIADTFVLSAAFYEHFGPDRRFHQLAHDVAAKSPLLGMIRRYGVVPASHDNARAAFDLGAPVLVYPGGDFETFRPTWHSDRIEFGGRQGFVKLALERDVPIVPVVAIGGQETALFVTRGQRAAKLLGLDKLTRIKVLPVSIGPPLGAADRPARALRRRSRPRRRLRRDHDRDAGRAQRAGRGALAPRRRLSAGIPMWKASPSTNRASTGWKAATHGVSSRAPTSMI